MKRAKGIFLFLITSLTILLGAESLTAQRRITPVTPTNPGTPTVKKENQEVDKSNLQEQLDAAGRVILVDTVTGTEYVDTLGLGPVVGNAYPLIAGVSVGVDVWDPVMRILGQKYGGIGFVGQLSLHNRFFPTLELGLSAANIRPDDMNYTFKSPLAPYFKLGGDYNIFYNSNNAYQLHVGLRYGFSAFSYSVADVELNNGYWDETTVFNIPSQKATVGYWEFVAGVRVKIAGPISMGWDFRYRGILHESKNTYGPTMYIPGYGKRSNPIAGSFYVIYTIPMNKSAYPKVNNSTTTN